MLADLGVRSLRLLTNNPDKIKGLADFGLEVTGTVALPVSATPHNLRYLMAKRDRMGHLIDLAEPGEPAATAAVGTGAVSR
jgi:3,4-dihydroxy 2-butanone 4-phosphate synthase/GTP cyclohydrolase II